MRFSRMRRASRRPGRGGGPRRRRSPSRRASSPRARRPGGRSPPSANRAGSIWRSVLPSSAGRASRESLRGVDRQRPRPSSRAPPSPPRSPPSWSSCRPRRSRRRCRPACPRGADRHGHQRRLLRERRDLLTPRSGVEHEGAAARAAATSLGQAGQLLALPRPPTLSAAAAAARLAACLRAAATASRAARVVRRRSSARARSVDPIDRHVRARRSAALQRHGLVDGISSGRATIATPVLRWFGWNCRGLCLRLDRSNAGDLRERSGVCRKRDALRPSPARRRSRGRSCAPSPPWRGAARSPDLSDRHQLAQPGGRRGEVGEDAGAEELSRIARPGAAEQQYSRIAWSRSIEIVHRFSAGLDRRGSPPRPVKIREGMPARRSRRRSSAARAAAAGAEGVGEPSTSHPSLPVTNTSRLSSRSVIGAYIPNGAEAAAVSP